MPSILLAPLLLLAQLAFPISAAGNAAHAAPPATQPSATDTREGETAAAAFDSWTIGKLFTGKKKLSPEELGHVEFWVSLVKEPLLAAVGFIPRIFVAAVFLFIFWLIYRGTRRLVVGSMSKANVDPSIREMLGHLIKWAVMGFGLVIAFNQIGIQITALLTGVSIVGLAIGLAAQETLANFIAGVVIFWDKPFRIGDTIEIDGSVGTVRRVTFRSTRMLSGDGEVIILPNTYVLARRLSNHSAHPMNRVNVPVSIAYRESIDAARSVLLSMVGDDSRVCPDPEPGVVVSECADSSVKLILRFWVRDQALSKPIYFEYTESAKKALDAAGIEIPFPHLQLLLDEQADAARKAG
jgi:small conductance mechanosensitive channel